MKRPQRPRPPGRQSSRATRAPRSPLARCATAESTRRPPGARKGGQRSVSSGVEQHRRVYLFIVAQRHSGRQFGLALLPLALTPCRRRREIAHQPPGKLRRLDAERKANGPVAASATYAASRSRRPKPARRLTTRLASEVSTQQTTGPTPAQIPPGSSRGVAHWSP